MTDETLAQYLTEALDARIDRAMEAKAPDERRNPVPEIREQTRETAERASVNPIRAIPVRRLRLRAAFAAALGLCVLGLGAFLLWKLPRHPGLTPAGPGETSSADPGVPTDQTLPSFAAEPENCSPQVLPDGETIWVLKGDWQGEYDVQKLSFPGPENEDAVLMPSDPPLSPVPEGFVRQEVLDYDAYAAWCGAYAEYGLRQAYTDPARRYLVISYAAGIRCTIDLRLAEVTGSGSAAEVWLWDRLDGYYGAGGSGYALTIPVPAAVETLTVRQVYTASEAEDQRLWHSTEITGEPEGGVTVRGWNARSSSLPDGSDALLFRLGSEWIALVVDKETEIVHDGVLPYQDYSSGLEILAEHCTALDDPGSLWPSRTDLADRWYRVGRLTVLSVDKATVYTSAKPVIYLYPETETRVEVKLNLDGELTCAYPAYEDGWTVTAAPDGTLTDERGQSYNYLYWEGENDGDFDFSEGFCVRGEDTAAFLEEALAKLGLTRREANEFIVYWLPLMQNEPYNLISFQGAAYTEQARLEVSPAPDTVIRVFMAWKPLDEPVEIPQQELTAPEREGFVLVEWGGCRVAR